jgi:hypothetical protein
MSSLANSGAAGDPVWQLSREWDALRIATDERLTETARNVYVALLLEPAPFHRVTLGLLAYYVDVAPKFVHRALHQLRDVGAIVPAGDR